MTRKACKVLSQLALVVSTSTLLGFPLEVQAEAWDVFHERIASAARTAIYYTSEPAGYGSHNLIQHKQELAEKIMERVKGLTGAEERYILGNLHHKFAAVVWEKEIRAGYQWVFRYNRSPVIPGSTEAQAMKSCTYALGQARIAVAAIPGLGAPCLGGNAVYAEDRLNEREGPWMSSMVFYLPSNYGLANRLDDKAQFFKDSVDHCCGELDTRYHESSIVSNIFLGDLAKCVHQDFVSRQTDRRRLIHIRGVAAVPAYRYPGQAQLHEAYGYNDPMGFLLMQNFPIQMVNGQYIAIHFFSM